VHLIGRTFENGDVYSMDLEATNIKYLGKGVLTRRIKMSEPLTGFGIKSKKTNIGMSFVWVSLVLVWIASFQFNINPVLTIGVLQCFAAVVSAHIIGHAITDGLVNWGKGKCK